MEELDKIELARMLANVLRHEPDRLNVQLDSEGWIDIESLLFGFDACSPFIVEREDIEDAVMDANYGRFEYDAEQDRLRAKKGHTTDHVSYDVAEPPEYMYRAVPAQHAEYLKRNGLKSVNRKYTQVFVDYMDAVDDGNRRGIETICMASISADDAYNDGTLFYFHDDEWYVVELDAVHIEISDYD